MRPGGVSWLRLKPRKTPHRGSSTWQKPSLLPWAISLKQEPAEELLQINATLRRNLQPLGWGGCQYTEMSENFGRTPGSAPTLEREATYSTRRKIRSHTPCPRRSPRFSNLVTGRVSGRGEYWPAPATFS